jgi:hypothetical protein
VSTFRSLAANYLTGDALPQVPRRPLEHLAAVPVEEGGLRPELRALRRPCAPAVVAQQGLLEAGGAVGLVGEMFRAASRPLRTNTSAVICRSRVCSVTWSFMKDSPKRTPLASLIRVRTPLFSFGTTFGAQRNGDRRRLLPGLLEALDHPR